jgi:hypothetical protein
MSERWCKLYPHALTDPLWLAVADDAGTSPGLVGATFVELLTWVTDHAPDTGSIAGFDPRVWAAWLRIAPEAVERIIASLRKFGRLAGDTIANWAKRQGQAAVAAAQEVKRKVTAGAERMRRYRRRKRQDDRQGEFFGEASHPPSPVTPIQSDQHVAPPVTVPSPHSPLKDSDFPRGSPQPPTAWGARQARRQEGTNPRALGTNPRAQRGLLLPFAGGRNRDTERLAALIDDYARRRQAGGDDRDFPAHLLAQIKARQVELFTNREAA